MKAVYVTSSRVSFKSANTSGLHLISSPSKSKLVCRFPEPCELRTPASLRSNLSVTTDGGAYTS